MADQVVEKILGKYETEADLDKALGEIHTKILSADVPLPPLADIEAKKKAYAAYEKALGSRAKEGANGSPTPPAPPKPAAAPTADPAAILTVGAQDDDPDVDSILAKAGLDAGEVSSQWAADGKLTDEQYASLKKVGYGRKLADTIATGQHARAILTVQQNQAIRAKAVDAVGGEEAFKNLNLWAEANLPKERLEAFNAMAKASPSAYPEVIRLVQAEHTAALGAGRAKPLVTGGDVGGVGTITDRKQYLELVAKMKAGDANAAATLNRMSPEDRAKFIK